MKLAFRKSGGFAPIFLGCQFDTAAEPGPEMTELEALITESNIITQTGKRVPQARDVYLYTFEIELNEKKNKVTFDQLSVPPEVKPLLDFCLARAQNMMPD
ncbi:MAG: hypothetical protein K2X27_14290 [Candidatus Obscuribacterales bacterium]|nr:hypothetical protein [Candidatus Obscuribacterales bacterium]